MSEYIFVGYKVPDAVFATKGYEFCIVEYRIAVGNIGDEEVGFVNFNFSPILFPGMSLDDKTIQHLKTRTLDISADHAHEHDPEIVKNR